MIVVEKYGNNLIKTYSDSNKYIRKYGTEEVYSEAVDIEGAPYEYIETDEEIEKFEEALGE